MRISDWSSDVCSSELLADEQDGRGFTRVVSGLPIPGATGVGCAECALHRRAQHRCIDALTALEMRKQTLRGPSDGVDLRYRTGRSGMGCGRESGHGYGRWYHGSTSESGMERAAGHSLDPEIGRAHDCTPVTNTHLVCRPPLETSK